MSRKKRILLPPSSAGLTRYQETTKQGIHIPPEFVIGFGMLVFVVEFVIHYF
jgi:preprotein translocase subunit Sec61beta